MSTEMNKSLTRRYFEEIWNRGSLEAVDTLVAADVSGHVPGATIHGAETLKQRIGSLYQIYSNPCFTVEDLIAEGDKVLARWTFHARHTGPFMGAPATGKEITLTGMNLFCIANGKIAEIWLNADDLGELRQLGVIPVPNL